ncbi:LysR family transcriptional regulator [Variovorax ginsengisoli]|uniref:LysR substrate-binding domain-containing protein n=1 Tax=Variovorax ginsengisoli TaxID=363844 RepID=A0ABT8RZV4_9BURK|nr:LysR family transcriptional regulator [Variovorax ginsengisoli]MDN8613028.1 LysR substrate-binding domain-containing protein [Variovorax ginsengisoli]MDO1532198.1 LysR substrate-binding domain-containing protein [Variovorax ginsengisoli]
MNRQFDDVMLGSIELFCLAAEQGSFTAAAAVASVTPAAVSRSISRLEERLGVRLFTRTTRQMRLTEAGRGYFEQCRQALNQLVEAEREASGHQVAPSGLLRISAPTTYGHYRLLPLLPGFRERFPAVKVEVNVSNRNIDFAEEGYDLAIRARATADSSLVSRLLEDTPLVVVASPDYLQRYGTPSTLDELQAHECIQFELPSSGRAIPWLFRRDGQELELQTSGGYACSDDVTAGATLARHGAGVFQAYRFVVEEDLRAGRLVELLQDFGGRSRPHGLLYPHRRFVPLRVRAFVDYLLGERPA